MGVVWEADLAQLWVRVPRSARTFFTPHNIVLRDFGTPGSGRVGIPCIFVAEPCLHGSCFEYGFERLHKY